MYQVLHVDGVKVTVSCGELTDSTTLARIIQNVQPDETYNVAAQPHVSIQQASACLMSALRPTASMCGR